jgi:hypothetical protein
MWSQWSARANVQKGGALRDDAEVMVDAWDPGASVEETFARSRKLAAS